MKSDRRHINSLRLSSGNFTNPRSASGLEPAVIRELAASIGTQGLLTPVLITQTGLVIAGQRRFHAIVMLITWHMRRVAHRVAGGDLATLPPFEIEPETRDTLERWTKHAVELEQVPVMIVPEDADLEALALTDNLHRVDMSSYEIAARLAHLHEQGATGANLARMTGKSKSWVSRKLSAWAGAGASLREAWRRGAVTDDQVQALAELQPAEQVTALAKGALPTRAGRGPAGRPGIDTVKSVLADLEPGWDRSGDLAMRKYAQGVRDALRWVTGTPATDHLLAIMKTNIEKD
jgi:ParB-like chromosome segregation protein Spo0J